MAGATKNVGALLLGGRERQTSAAHWHMGLARIGETKADRAVLVRACREIGICLRTLKRWRNAFLGDGYGIAPVKAVPG